MRRLSILLLIVSFLVSGCGYFSGENNEVNIQTPSVTDITIQDWQLQVEVADSKIERIKGLSHRSNLPQDSGMLFVYDEPRIQNFWMKDTKIPLSIAFIKSDGTVVEIKKMEPYSLKTHYSSEPVKYALEVNEGWFEKRNLTPPFSVQIESPKLLSRTDNN